MRTAILLCLFAVFGYMATAQLTLLPLVGLENSRTKVDYNDLSSRTGCMKAYPQVGLRLDYKFKNMHGPYIGLATSRSIVEYKFSDPDNGMNEYSNARGNTQLSMEAGYQLSTKPIYFKSKSSSTASSMSTYKGHCLKYVAKTGCGRKVESVKQDVSKGTWVKLVPSLGVAFIPFAPSSEIEAKSDGAQISYQYNAGNWNTAITGGLGFQFGRNTKQGVLVSLSYLHGIGSALDTKTITTVEGNKLTNTNLSSTASSWNVGMGIPISLSKKKSIVKEPVSEKVFAEEKRCGQYKIQYKSRCTRTLTEQ